MTALELLQSNATLEVFDLEGIPPLNQDQETWPPDRVRLFKEMIRAADSTNVEITYARNCIWRGLAAGPTVRCG